MATSGYTPTGTYNDAALSSADKAKIDAYKQQWETAFYNNDRAGMDTAHAGAEAVRAQYGYSGGADGSGYSAIESPSQPQYTRAVIAGPSSAESYINSIYAVRQEAALAALKAAYDQNVLTLDAQGRKITPYYQDARNAAATQSELSRAAFNELAAAKGLGSGAGGQASLAMSGALQREMTGLARAEADTMDDIETERARLETAYKNSAVQAIADGNLARAQALYNEYTRVDDALMSTSRAQASEDYNSWNARNSTYNANYDYKLNMAQILAKFGDFSGFLELGFTPQQIQMMQEAYAMQHAV